MKTWKSSSPPPSQQIQMYSSHIGGNTFLDYEKESDLSLLLKNKKIAVVGPSNNLVGTKSGSYIDSFDIVVRPGQLQKLSENYFEDYGSKTDIVFHSFNVWEKEIALSNIDFLKTLKFVVGCMVCVYECNEYEDFKNKLVENGIKFHKPNDRYIFKLFEEVGTTISCGISSILILLNYEIESLYITGMDFYNMGKYGKVYRDDYYDVVSKNSQGYIKYNESKELSSSDARVDLHDQETQILFLKELVAKDNRIKLDNFLIKNL